MSFDKEKVRRAAEKNLSQGKIQAAIRDYCQIVEHDSKDYNTLNTLGDLYVRVNAKDEAIACFSRIAEHYNSQGFAHKAIAVYKKILRLLPRSVEISSKLAPLYQTLGLTAEARSYYLIVAESFQKKGDSLRALETWSRIADLDPNDTKMRLQLAENYLRENQSEKAAEAFAEAGNRLLAKKQIEEAQDAFNQALELSPFDLTALSGIANANVALGFPDEAAGRLENAYAMYPESTEILSLLAHVYVEAGNEELAERYVSKLVEQEPSSYQRYLDVVKLYLKNNNAGAAARVLGYCGEMFISSNQEEELLKWVNEILARDPEQLTALRLLARVRAWQHNEDELKTALERLAESAQLNNSPDDERSALLELVALFPEDERYVNRLRELGTTVETPAVSARQEQLAQTENVPTFESFNSFDGDYDAQFSDDNLVTAVSEQTNFADQNPFDQYSIEETSEQVNGHSTNILTEQYAENSENGYQSGNAFDELIEVAGRDYQTTVSTEAAEPADDKTNGIFPSEQDNATADFTFEVTDSHTWSSIDASNESDSAFAERKFEVQLQQELDSIDFYISQNLDDVALNTLDQLEKRFGPHAEIDKRRQQLGGASAVSASPDQQVAVEAQPQETIVVEVEPQVNDPLVVTVEPQVTEYSTKHVKAASGFEDLFAEFGDDLEVAALSSSQTADYETHYNLGLAYKDMDLLDDAVEEFQNAVKMVAPGDGTPRYLQCCNLIGHCFMEKDMPKLAIMWYQRGIESPGHSEDEYQALRYELATAYEKAGENNKALEIFAGIYAVNVTYRGVSEKVKTLQAA